jgi:hypothetical protein
MMIIATLSFTTLPWTISQAVDQTVFDANGGLSFVEEQVRIESDVLPASAARVLAKRPFFELID